MLRPPEKIIETHDIEGFSCGEESLDIWLKKKALKNEKDGGSGVYVLCLDNRVIGYYALAAGSVTHAMATGPVKRNMPNPVPVMVLGRLAVDKDYQKMGLGPSLLRDAILRTLQVSEIVGIKAILVHAISEEACLFYKKMGFKESPVDSMTLMITLKDARAACEA